MIKGVDLRFKGDISKHIQEDVVSNHKDRMLEEERNLASSSNVMRERFST